MALTQPLSVVAPRGSLSYPTDMRPSLVPAKTAGKWAVVPPFATVLETNGCAMPSVNLQHYSLNRPFEWVPTQNANNVEDSPTGRRMGVNRDFMAYKKTQWLPFPPAVFAETRRPRSSYGRAYGRRVSAAAAIGKRSCLAHWGPDDTSTGQNSRDTPPLYLVPLARDAYGTGFFPPSPTS